MDMIEKDREYMTKLSMYKLSEDLFICHFNKMINECNMDSLLMKANLDKDVVLSKMISYRNKYKPSAALEIACLQMFSGLVEDYIKNDTYKRELFVHDVYNTAAVYLGNILGLDNF